MISDCVLTINRFLLLFVNRLREAFPRMPKTIYIKFHARDAFIEPSAPQHHQTETSRIERQ